MHKVPLIINIKTAINILFCHMLSKNLFVTSIVILSPVVVVFPYFGYNIPSTLKIPSINRIPGLETIISSIR